MTVNIVSKESLKCLLKNKNLDDDQVNRILEVRNFFGDALSFDLVNIILFAIDQGKIMQVLERLEKIQTDHFTVHPDLIPRDTVMMSEIKQIWNSDLGFKKV